MEKVCKTCEGPLEPNRIGRPRVYCSRACQRFAEFAARRANIDPATAAVIDAVNAAMRGQRAE